MKSNSQSLQDIFALSICGTESTYIEIGANRPKKNSNTYLLETSNSWKGFSLELDTSFIPWWEDCKERKNKIYWGDALTFDYKNAIKENNLNLEIGYLSCDIEPPYNTFAALQRVLEQGVSFKCITFEHDLYQYTDKNFNEISKSYLQEMGYKVAVTDVYWKHPENHFETWFVRNDIEFEKTTFDRWKENI